MTSGLADLVAAARLLAAAAGGSEAALEVAARLVTGGVSVLGRVDDDAHRALRDELVRTGVLTPIGAAVAGRAGEFVAVCEILAAAPPPRPRATPEPRIVFSAPAGLVELSPAERLDGLVLDVIRCATTGLVIGGAFWNEAGFRLLDDVLRPAVAVRRVPTVLVMHPPAAPYRNDLVMWTDELVAAGPVQVRWYCGAELSMMHAKFVIANATPIGSTPLGAAVATSSTRGYLGTANLTSYGLGLHIEAGVELLAGQCVKLLAFLGRLEVAGLFSSHAST